MLGVHSGLMPLPCPLWMGPGSMEVDSSSCVARGLLVMWRTERAGRAFEVSANVAGLWGESGHLGSLGFSMPFAPKDQAGCVCV